MGRIIDPAADAGLVSSSMSGSGSLNGAQEPHSRPALMVHAIGILRRRRWLVIGAVILVVGASLVLVRSQQPVYKATATIRVADARRTVTSGIEEPEADAGRLINPLLSQTQLLRSRGLLGQIVDSMGLRLRPNYDGFSPRLLAGVYIAPDVPPDTLVLKFDTIGVHVSSRLGTAAARYGDTLRLGGIQFAVSERPRVSESVWTVSTRERAVDHLLSNLRVVPRSQTDIVDVSFSAERPTLAQRVANAVVLAFRETSVRSAQEQSRRRRVFLEEQLWQTDSMLAHAQLALSEFRRRERVYSSRDKLASQQRDLTTLELRRSELSAERGMFQSLLDRLTTQGPEARSERLRALVLTSEIAASPVIAPLYRQLTQYQVTRDSLTTGLWRSPVDAPDVTRIDELILATEEHLASAVRGHIAGLAARMEALDQLETRTVARIQELPENEAEEVRLIQQVETIRHMGNQLREEFQKARMAEAVELGHVEIVDLAAFPHRALPQRRHVKLAFALLVGLLAGGVGAMGLEMRRPAIRRREELEGLLRIPTLATVPKLAVDQTPRMTRRFAPLLRVRSNGFGDVAPAPASGLVALSRQPSIGAESYRVLHANLMFSELRQGLKTLAVMSATPSEGKTVTAANLGVTCARDGIRVLLVDCDLRRARVHRLFGVSQSPGLSTLLSDPASAPLTIRATAVDGLFVLPSGSRDEDSSELLRGDRMRQFLRSVGPWFDLIILDTPPLLSVAESVMLGALCDGVLLVVRAGQTEQAVAQQALRRLAHVNARVIGAVLNDSADATELDERYFATYAMGR